MLGTSRPKATVTPDEVYTMQFSISLGEIGSVLCRGALWVCFEGQILNQFPARLCFLNSPMVNPHGAVPQHQPSPTREPQCLKPRGNRPNIVGCYMLGTFAHPVACCQELLRKVFETGQTFSSVQTDATTLDNVGSCCVRLHAAQQSSCDFK